MNHIRLSMMVSEMFVLTMVVITVCSTNLNTSTGKSLSFRLALREVFNQIAAVSLSSSHKTGTYSATPQKR
jgi:hypothetical protein